MLDDEKHDLPLMLEIGWYNLGDSLSDWCKINFIVSCKFVVTKLLLNKSFVNCKYVELF